MNIDWTPNARRQLDAIRAYIAQDSEKNARVVIQRIARRAKQLTDFPYLGASAPESVPDEIREVLENPYRIFYRVVDERIEILAIVHSSRSFRLDVLGE